MADQTPEIPKDTVTLSRKEYEKLVKMVRTMDSLHEQMSELQAAQAHFASTPSVPVSELVTLLKPSEPSLANPDFFRGKQHELRKRSSTISTFINSR